MDNSSLIAIDDLAERAPDELFVLVLPANEESRAGLELRRTQRGDLIAIAYTGIEPMVAACGSGQPWAKLPTAELEHLADQLGITLVALDAELPEGHRYPEADVGELPDMEPVEPIPETATFYLPSRPFRHGDTRALLELQPDPRGRPLLLVFTSAELLCAGCGPNQAWVAIPAHALPDTVRETGAHRVLFNPILAEQSRHQGPVLDW